MPLRKDAVVQLNDWEPKVPPMKTIQKQSLDCRKRGYGGAGVRFYLGKIASYVRKIKK